MLFSASGGSQLSGCISLTSVSKVTFALILTPSSPSFPSSGPHDPGSSLYLKTLHLITPAKTFPLYHGDIIVHFDCQLV